MTIGGHTNALPATSHPQTPGGLELPGEVSGGHRDQQRNNSGVQQMLGWVGTQLNCVVGVTVASKT